MTRTDISTDDGHRRIEPGGSAPSQAPRSWYRKPTGWLIAIVIVGSFALWAYALSGAARKDPPDTLDDPAYGLAAQPICAATRARIDALPPAPAARSPQERAGVLAGATNELSVMVGQLRSLPQTTEHDRGVLGSWLADWDRYLADRQAYAEVLATGTDARFVLSAAGGEIFTRSMDNLAMVNDMAACATPGDV